MDRKAFFDGIRQQPFPGKLRVAQVSGISAVLDECVKSKIMDVRWIAYILATVFWETGQRMMPVREGFATTDAGARAAVAKLFAQGRISRNYALPEANGISYYGRGRVQCTHLTNYRKLEKRFGLPFVSQPDLLLDSAIDAKVTVTGHVEGLWTKYDLSDFFNDKKRDWVGARRIVNGQDHAQDIAGMAKLFFADIVAAS